MKIDMRKILFCGDSLIDENVIKNTGLEWNCEYHWTSILAKILDVPYNNTAICGDTIANIKNNVNSRILKYDPSFVILDGGVNDCGGGASASTVKENMRATIQNLLDNNKQVALIWFPVAKESWNSFSPSSDFLTLPTKYIELANQFESKYSDSFCLLNLEGKSGLGNTGNYIKNLPQENRIDGLHFNPSGQKVITEHVLSLLSEIDDSISTDAGVQRSRARWT